MFFSLVATLAYADPTPPPIINGESADEDDFPMTGGLVLSGHFDFGRQGEYDATMLICSSTLIAPDVVLAAAHCLDPEVMTYGMGEITDMDFRWSRQADLTRWDGSSSVKTFPDDAAKAWDWEFHEDFDINGLGYGLTENFDIGIVFLEEPILDVTPAVLVTEEEGAQIVEGAEVDIVGWGQQEATDMWEQPEPGTYAVKMQARTVIGEVGEAEFQVGPKRNDGRKCHGDSGGPTFMTVESDSTEAMRQIGVTSHAYDSTDCDSKGGVDTRLDHYLAWIDAQMRSRCGDGSRAWCDEAGILPAPLPGDDEGDDNGDDVAGDDDEIGLQPGGCSTASGSATVGAAAIAVGALLLRRRR